MLTHPENTMAAFNEARRLGADAIEFDVHATADGHLVVHHDYDLSRTTSGSGYVHERTLSYVQSLSAGAWLSSAFAAERVPLLEEVLALDSIGFELELKGLPTLQLIDGIVRAVRDANVVPRLELTGFHFVAVPRLREALPAVRLGLFAPAYQSWMTPPLYEDIVLHTAITGGYDVVHAPARHCLGFRVERFHDAGLLVHCHDTDAPDDLTLAVRLCDQISTSDIVAARRAVDAQTAPRPSSSTESWRQR
jgi:glycerophosphoryl diester phosphodiesterase